MPWRQGKVYDSAVRPRRRSSAVRAAGLWRQRRLPHEAHAVGNHPAWNPARSQRTECRQRRALCATSFQNPA
jgi:hypothetical protein